MIPYVKAHACGNDFLIVDERVAHDRHAAIARAMCARCSGIGADGVEFVNGQDLRLFNSDGSEAEISGNGTRCVAAWLAYSEGKRELTLGTKAGDRSCRVISAEGSHFEIESEMGVPIVATQVERVAGVDGVIVTTGNPHFVVFVDGETFSYGGASWMDVGREISSSSCFLKGTNVEFVRILNDNEIAIRIYERGAGPTRSSGTGSCAAAAASITMRGLSRKLRVEAPGGSQTTLWEDAQAQMRLTGPADLIAKGETFR